MSGVFRNIDLPPPHRPVSVYPSALVRGEDTLARGRRGGGSKVRKMPDTALYSIYVSTLCLWVSMGQLLKLKYVHETLVFAYFSFNKCPF
jgi:hypothetical protein